jgi:hypothetical protein
MEMMEANPNDFQETSEADKQLLVRFYLKNVQDKTESAKEGRPIFKEREYIEIRFPGNRSDAVARPATDADKSRFYRHYEAFQKRVEAPTEGTPLLEWGPISRSQAEELAFYNVKTVEHLANMSDTHCNQFMGIHALRKKAKDFLAASEAGVSIAELKDELQRRDEQIKLLQAQMDEILQAQQNARAEAKMPMDDFSESSQPDTPTKSPRRRKAS